MYSASGIYFRLDVLFFLFGLFIFLLWHQIETETIWKAGSISQNDGTSRNRIVFQSLRAEKRWITARVIDWLSELPITVFIAAAETRLSEQLLAIAKSLTHREFFKYPCESPGSLVSTLTSSSRDGHFYLSQQMAKKSSVKIMTANWWKLMKDPSSLPPPHLPSIKAAARYEMNSRRGFTIEWLNGLEGAIHQIRACEPTGTRNH